MLPKHACCSTQLPLLLMSPLLDMTVRWCQVEVVTALLLTAVWRRAHGGKHGGSRRHGAVTGRASCAGSGK